MRAFHNQQSDMADIPSSQRGLLEPLINPSINYDMNGSLGGEADFLRFGVG